jgi:hypothetical protein
MRTRLLLAVLFSTVIGSALTLRADDNEPIPATQNSEETAKAEETAKPEESPAAEPAAKPVVKKKNRAEIADAFIAPPDWEFDGFVAGGTDQDVRSLYYLNDLVYLNVGSDQGFNSGDRISIYKRGQRIRDPQNGKFLGYEVRRAATSQVTDRIDGSNCSVRILQANEAVEVGDLVRRAE